MTWTQTPLTGGTVNDGEARQNSHQAWLVGSESSAFCGAAGALVPQGLIASQLSKSKILSFRAVLLLSELSQVRIMENKR